MFEQAVELINEHGITVCLFLRLGVGTINTEEADSLLIESFIKKHRQVQTKSGHKGRRR